MPIPIPNLNQLQINPAQPATATLQGMEFKDRSRRTDIAEDRNAIAREGMALDEKTFKHNKMKSELAIMRDFMPGINPGNMDDVKAQMQRIGVPQPLIDLLPDSQKSLKMPKDEWDDTKGRLIYGADKVLEMEAAEVEATTKEAEAILKRQQKLEDEVRKRQQEMEDYEKKQAILKKNKEESAAKKKTEKVISKLELAAIEAGVDLNDFKTRPTTPEESEALAEKAAKVFAKLDEHGSKNFMQMLFEAGVSAGIGGAGPIIQFDETGELVEQSEQEIGPEGQTIIRNKMPSQ